MCGVYVWCMYVGVHACVFMHVVFMVCVHACICGMCVMGWGVPQSTYCLEDNVVGPVFFFHLYMGLGD